MFSRTVLFASAALLLSSALVTPAAAQSSAREGRVHISVTGSDGRVLPLTAADVTVSEDGRAREVLRVARAEGPLQIALLVDDSQAAQPAISDMRTGLKQFVNRILTADATSEIALITFGERPTLVTDYTSSREQLERGISRIFARQGAGAYMLEALTNAARGATVKAGARAHLVVVGTEGTEFSNDHYTRVLDELARSGATLWALTLTSGARAAETDETRNRAIVLGRGTEQSGGRQEQVLANSAIPAVLERVGSLILNQYVVVYGRPETLLPPESITVAVTVPGARVLAPATAPPARKPGRP